MPKQPLAVINRDGKPCPALAYIGTLAAGSQPGTRSKLRQAALRMFVQAGQLYDGDPLLAFPWASLRFDHVEYIRSAMVSDKKSPATINATLAALKGVASMAFRYELMDSDTLMRIKMTKSARGTRKAPGRAIPRDQIAALYRACRKDRSLSGKRDLAFLMLGFETALRRAEFAEAQIDDIYEDDDGDMMISIIGKGNKERELLIPPKVARAIARWLEAIGDPETGPLFCAIDRHDNVSYDPLSPAAMNEILQRRANQAEIPHVSAHDIRRTYISDGLDADIDLGTMADIAGHSSVDTTRRYDRSGSRRKKAAQRIASGPKKVLALDHKGRAK